MSRVAWGTLLLLALGAGGCKGVGTYFSCEQMAARIDETCSAQMTAAMQSVTAPPGFDPAASEIWNARCTSFPEHRDAIGHCMAESECDAFARCLSGLLPPAP